MTNHVDVNEDCDTSSSSCYRLGSVVLQISASADNLYSLR